MPVLDHLRQKIARSAETWFESPGAGTRLLPMEGLRGLAVLAVFFVHAHAFFGLYLNADPGLFRISEYLGRAGNVGVDLFFVLSGFLIYGALVHKRVRYVTFLQRRAKRIYPAFLAVLGCYFVLSVLFPAESRIPARAPAAVKYIFENIAFLPGLFPITPIVTVAWSLSFEFAFYLVVPLLVVILRRGGGNKIVRLAFLTATGVVFCVVEALFLGGAQIRMLSFISGMLLQEVAGSGWIHSLVSRAGQWISIAALIFLASYHFALSPGGPGAQPIGVVSTALMSVAVFFVVLHALEYPGVLQKVCTWAPMRYWGNFSYSYYLVHGLALRSVALLLPHSKPAQHSLPLYFCALIGGLIATWMSAIVLYLLVERPLSLTLKRPRASAPAAEGAELSWWMRRGRPAAEVSGRAD
ncbi:MAG TPA: acyltransferase [Bryobacteraceae bacterium]|jgi:peptidoglycan/LPS O-acetylase OafA/YrhL|nr:acyltransferase [Bryobacteraceae bacterium]